MRLLKKLFVGATFLAGATLACIAGVQAVSVGIFWLTAVQTEATVVEQHTNTQIAGSPPGVIGKSRAYRGDLGGYREYTASKLSIRFRDSSNNERDATISDTGAAHVAQKIRVYYSPMVSNVCFDSSCTGSFWAYVLLVALGSGLASITAQVLWSWRRRKES